MPIGPADVTFSSRRPGIHFGMFDSSSKNFQTSSVGRSIVVLAIIFAIQALTGISLFIHNLGAGPCSQALQGLENEADRKEAFDDFLEAAKEEVRKGPKGEESVVGLVLYLQGIIDALRTGKDLK